MTEAWRIKQSILVWDKILILSLLVGCFYRKGPVLSKAHKTQTWNCEIIRFLSDYTKVIGMSLLFSFTVWSNSYEHLTQ